MDKYKSAVLEYEQARQEVASLKKKRKEVMSKCVGLNDDAEHIIKYRKDMRLTGFCLVDCFSIMSRMNHEEFCPESPEPTYSFDEVLFNYGCESCNASFSLKRGELAEAKQRFGVAKRVISQLGKGVASAD